LATVAGEGAEKLMRAPTLVVASYVPSPLPLHAAEDEQAAACAIYAVLLAAEAEGLASYWRTPGILRSEAGRTALQLPDEERTLGLLHFGHARKAPPEAPARTPVEDYTTWLD
jgi:nitroreductase